MSENKTTSPILKPTASPKVGFVSLGCPKNLVDSEVMMGLLARAGAQLTPAAADADVKALEAKIGEKLQLSAPAN